MAATRKSAKRAGKKRAGAKRSSAKKSSARKKAVRKAAKSTRNPLASVKQAGEKTWEALKSTTAQVVEGVRDRFE